MPVREPGTACSPAPRIPPETSAHSIRPERPNEPTADPNMTEPHTIGSELRQAFAPIPNPSRSSFIAFS